MNKSKLFIVVLTLSITSTFATKYKCSFTNNGQDCSLSGVNATKTDIEIEPANGVRNFYLKDSTIETLSATICKSMPNVRNIEMDQVTIGEIEKYAFQNCKKLLKFSMEEVNVETVNKNAFKGMVQLQKLSIIGGTFPVADIDVTDLSQLKFLMFSALSLTDFSVEILREQKNLQVLYLYSNKLFDLDVEALLKYTPKLTRIYIADNNFKCTRLRTILQVLQTKNVQVNSFYQSHYFRERSYIPDNLNVIHCLTDLQWEAEFEETTFDRLKSIKISNFPLGESIMRMMQKMNGNSEKITSLEEASTELSSVMDKYDSRLKTIEENASNVNAALEAFVKKFDESLKNHDDQLLKVKETLNSLENMIEHSLKTHDAKFIEVNEDLKVQEKKFEQVFEAQDEKIAETNEVLKIQGKTLNDSLQTYDENFFNFTETLKLQEQKLKETLESQDAKIDTIKDYLNTLENKFENSLKAHDENFTELTEILISQEMKFKNVLETQNETVNIINKTMQSQEKNVEDSLKSQNDEIKAIYEVLKEQRKILGDSVIVQDGKISNFKEVLNAQERKCENAMEAYDEKISSILGTFKNFEESLELHVEDISNINEGLAFQNETFINSLEAQDAKILKLIESFKSQEMKFEEFLESYDEKFLNINETLNSHHEKLIEMSKTEAIKFAELVKTYENKLLNFSENFRLQEEMFKNFHVENFSNINENLKSQKTELKESLVGLSKNISNISETMSSQGKKCDDSVIFLDEKVFNVSEILRENFNYIEKDVTNKTDTLNRKIDGCVRTTKEQQTKLEEKLIYYNQTLEKAFTNIESYLKEIDLSLDQKLNFTILTEESTSFGYQISFWCLIVVVFGINLITILYLIIDKVRRNRSNKNYPEVILKGGRILTEMSEL